MAFAGDNSGNLACWSGISPRSRYDAGSGIFLVPVPPDGGGGWETDGADCRISGLLAGAFCNLGRIFHWSSVVNMPFPA